jgi:hypothetical protein
MSVDAFGREFVVLIGHSCSSSPVMVSHFFQTRMRYVVVKNLCSPPKLYSVVIEEATILKYHDSTSNDIQKRNLDQ